FIFLGGLICVIWTALQMAWLQIPMNEGAPEPNMFANIFGMYVLSPQNYISIVFGVAGAVFVMAMTMRNKKKAAITADHTDINTYARSEERRVGKESKATGSRTDRKK